jgi:hypothetical protein
VTIIAELAAQKLTPGAMSPLLSLHPAAPLGVCTLGFLDHSGWLDIGRTREFMLADATQDFARSNQEILAFLLAGRGTYLQAEQLFFEDDGVVGPRG